jgi:hypothetical protein
MATTFTRAYPLRQGTHYRLTSTRMEPQNPAKVEVIYWVGDT